MTRIDHFVRGNALSLSNIAEWATMQEPKLRAVVAGDAVPKLYEAYRLAAACSYLLGRRVRITELFDLEAHGQ